MFLFKYIYIYIYIYRLVIFILVIPITMLSLLNPEPGVDFAGHMGGVMVGLTLGLAFAAEDSSLRMYFNLICFN